MGMEFLEWYNLIFNMPFLFALFYLLLLATGTVATEHGFEADAGIDHDVDLDHDLGIEHDLSHGLEHYHNMESGHEPGTLLKALSVIGLGKVPLSIIMLCFCFIWGFAGFTSNKIFHDVLEPWLFIWPSLGIALTSSVFFTGYLAKGLSRILPTMETYGTSMDDFVGKLAEVNYSITATSGSAFLRDKHGNFYEVPCRIETVEKQEIESGSQVILMGYNSDENVFIVRRDPLSLEMVKESRLILSTLTNGKEKY